MAADTEFWWSDKGLCLDPNRARSNAFCNQVATDNSHAWMMARTVNMSTETYNFEDLLEMICSRKTKGGVLVQ